MDAGKTASQAGHAYVGAAFLAQATHPSVLSAYHKDLPHSPGVKVCLRIKSPEALFRAEHEARAAGLPVFRVVDSGCANFFNGLPVVTALGIGPATRDQVPFLRKHQLLTSSTHETRRTIATVRRDVESAVS